MTQDAGSEVTVLYVDIYKSKRRLTGRQRAQPWRWRLKSEGNSKVLAVSSEAYTNREDCLAAIVKVFSGSTTVFLRRREQDGWPEGTKLGLQAIRWSNLIPNAPAPDTEV